MLKRSDICFEVDDTGRFLPWLIAFMVYLAALSIAGLFLISGLTQQFGTGIANTMTVQIPITGSASKDTLLRDEVLMKLNGAKGVKSSRHVPVERIAELLSPWLGTAIDSEQIPLPQVIDVKVDRSTGITPEKLLILLNDTNPSIVIDDHGEWLASLLHALRSAKLFALIVVTLIGIATIGTVVFTTRTGMGLHKDNIIVLHFIGAKDSYIAKQFAVRAAWLGLKGGIGGLVFALPTLFALRLTIGSLNTGLLPELKLSATGWISLALIVPCVAIIAHFTARSTVLKSLSKQL